MAPVVIVTGASRGIGRAIARTLLASPQDANIVAVARSQDALEALSKEDAAYKDRVAVLPGDFRDHSLGQKAVDLAVQRWGRLDAVIINHGVLEPCARVADADPKEWSNTYEINIISYVSMAKAAIPALRASSGRIVMISSGAAVTGYLGWATYGSSKAAVNHLALTLAREETGITTLAIRPGVCDTGMQDDVRNKYLDVMGDDAQQFLRVHKEGKLLRPEQPGTVIVRLAIGATKDLSGKFLSWNAPELKQYQE